MQQQVYRYPGEGCALSIETIKSIAKTARASGLGHKVIGTTNVVQCIILTGHEGVEFDPALDKLLTAFGFEKT